ncbi:hypothetical protein SEA_SETTECANDELA_193 [Mycobacterium phage Settecandela]|nr:hypothetical protein SEA_SETTECANDELA_193 [Mycobacterium phage Settecandela]
MRAVGAMRTATAHPAIVSATNNGVGGDAVAAAALDTHGELRFGLFLLQKVEVN